MGFLLLALTSFCSSPFLLLLCFLFVNNTFFLLTVFVRIFITGFFILFFGIFVVVFDCLSFHLIFIFICCCVLAIPETFNFFCVGRFVSLFFVIHPRRKMRRKAYPNRVFCNR